MQELTETDPAADTAAADRKSLLWRIRYTPAPAVVWDRGEAASVTGLHLKISKGRDGRVSRGWFFYYRAKGAPKGKDQRRPKIGEYPVADLREARRRAIALQRLVVAGGDPKGEWEAAKAERTVADAWEVAAREHYSQPRYQKSRWGIEAKRVWEVDLKEEFGSLPLSKVTADHVRAWHAGYLESKPYQGNRAKAILSFLFTTAIAKTWLPQAANPCRLVSAHEEHERERYATDVELARIGAILIRRSDERLAASSFMLLLLLSGSRPIAIEQATWDQLTTFEQDGRRHGLLTFYGKSSARKTRGAKVVKEQVPLPPEAMDVILKLPRIVGSTITGIKMPRAFWNEVRAEAGCSDLWLRDSRRTWATTGITEGIPLDQIGGSMNHKDPRTTKTYGKVVPTVKLAVSAKIGTAMWAKLTAGEKQEPPATETGGAATGASKSPSR